jgi:ER lumen protein retaining receptor
VVFVTRYLDLLWSWISFYNFVMKLFFIGSSCYVLYLMKIRFRYAIRLRVGSVGRSLIIDS